MLSADLVGRFGAQIGLEQVQNWPEDRQAGKPERAALVFEARNGWFTEGFDMLELREVEALLD
jgi:hypothetical protein